MTKPPSKRGSGILSPLRKLFLVSTCRHRVDSQMSRPRSDLSGMRREVGKQRQLKLRVHLFRFLGVLIADVSA